MTYKDVRTTLQHYKNDTRGGAPRDGWVKENREVLLMQVRNTVDQQRTPSVREIVGHFFSVFLPAETVRMVGSAAAVFLLVAGSVIGGGLASAQAYRDANPGGVLYAMKLAVERAQLAVAPNDEYRARLHAEFADRRIDELVALSEQPADRQAAAVTVTAGLGNELQAVADGLDRLRTEDPTEVIQVAKLVERKMDLYRNQLTKAGRTLPEGLRGQVAVLHDLADNVTIKAMAIIVEKHLAGDLQAPKAVVITKIQERLQQAESDLDAAVGDQEAGSTPLASTTKAKAAIAEAKQLLKKEDYQAALDKIVEVAQLTKEVQTTTDAAAAQAVEDAKPSTEGTDATKTPIEDGSLAPDPTGSTEPSADAAGSGGR
jgi:hypothetical protein